MSAPVSAIGMWVQSATLGGGGATTRLLQSGCRIDWGTPFPTSAQWSERVARLKHRPGALAPAVTMTSGAQVRRGLSFRDCPDAAPSVRKRREFVFRVRERQWTQALSNGSVWMMNLQRTLVPLPLKL
jgi:hypothetical protein